MDAAKKMGDPSPLSSQAFATVPQKGQAAKHPTPLHPTLGCGGAAPGPHSPHISVQGHHDKVPHSRHSVSHRSRAWRLNSRCQQGLAAMKPFGKPSLPLASCWSFSGIPWLVEASLHSSKKPKKKKYGYKPNLLTRSLN